LHCAVLPPGKSMTTNFQKFIILIDSILIVKNYNFLKTSLHGGRTSSYLSHQKKKFWKESVFSIESENISFYL